MSELQTGSTPTRRNHSIVELQCRQSRSCLCPHCPPSDQSKNAAFRERLVDTRWVNHKPQSLCSAIAAVDRRRPAAGRRTGEPPGVTARPSTSVPRLWPGKRLASQRTASAVGEGASILAALVRPAGSGRACINCGARQTLQLFCTSTPEYWPDERVSGGKRRIPRPNKINRLETEAYWSVRRQANCKTVSAAQFQSWLHQNSFVP